MPKIFGPREMLLVRHEQGLDDLARLTAAKIGLSVIPSEDVLVPYINHGRWVADCPCGAGIAINPLWSTAACLDTGCHRTFSHISMPADWQELEGALLLRPFLKNRNWTRQETLNDLRVENFARGLGV